uniref:Pentacotripeptide-repeat region of PRORP domain-containing protein n=1 Tax=Pseudo-nitzschia delicatissima TaxID=44447 RepID=A0A7S0UGU6_9STRA|mmetsp:Transcript_3873/g.8089  ORF Transcript_3873/g.8089 Transcript_3873/m.8089 type:complete len:274 (+) Transcript_3873:2-823(+)
MQEHNVVPDTVSYNTIIHGHARLGNLDRALELLTRLLDDALTNSQNTDRSRHQGSLYPKPNVRTFTNILIALSQEKTVKAAEEAEHLLVRMQELNDPPYNLDTRPNTITYNAVMNCWATLSLPSSRRQRKNQQQSTNDNEHHRFGHKADFVLRSMQGLGKNERPNAISYNIVIRAYSNDMNKAEELVQDMISNGIEPTDHTYNTLVHVLNRDLTIKDKDKKLEELRDLYFASSSFPLENGRSPNKNRNAGKKRNNGNNNGKKTKNNSGRRRQQ